MFCLVVPDLMTIEIAPVDIQQLFEDVRGLALLSFAVMPHGTPPCEQQFTHSRVTVRGTASCTYPPTPLQAIKAASDRMRQRVSAAAAEEQKAKEAAMSPEELEAYKKQAGKQGPPKPGRGGGKKVMDAEVFSDFALPMVRGWRWRKEKGRVGGSPSDSSGIMVGARWASG